MLESIRQYAQDRLIEAQEGEVLRDRHAAYFAVLADKASQQMLTPEEPTWFRRLSRSWIITGLS